MTLIRSFIIFSIGFASLWFTSFGFAAATLEPVTVGYSTFSGAYLPLWIAVEDRLGRKYGLDLNAIYAGRTRPQQLLASAAGWSGCISTAWPRRWAYGPQPAAPPPCAAELPTGPDFQ